MLFTLTLLVPLLVGALWLYFRFSPKRANRRPVIWFDVLAVTASLIVAAAIVAVVKGAMQGGADESWWPVLAAFCALIAIPACLGVAAAIRHLLFRKKGEVSKPLETRDLSKTRF